jgi:hypothetical protein
MFTQLARLRTQAFARQQGLCIYCQHPMWQSDLANFATTCGLTLRQARRYQCTAEHLTARQDGGGDSPDNIAAACLACNQQRHRRKQLKTPAAYTAFVQRRLAQGRWHCRQCPRPWRP